MNIKYYIKTSTFRNYKYIFSNNIYSYVLNFITFVLVTRAFERKTYGIYSSLIAFLGIFQSIGNLGYNQFSISQISVNKEKVIEMFNKMFELNILMIIIIFLISLFLKNLIFKDISIYVFLLFFAFSILIQLYNSSFKSLLQATENMDILAKILSIRPTILFIITLAFYITKKLSLVSFLFANIISSLILLSLFYYKCKMKFKLKLKKIKFLEIFIELKYSIYFLLGSLAFMLFVQTDKIMLAKFDSYSSVAIYNVSYKLVYYAYFPVLSLMTVVYPGFFKKGKKGVIELMTYIKKLIPPVFLYVTSAMIFLFCFSFFLTKIFGSKYYNSEQGLRIIIFMLPLQVLSFIFGDFLTGVNKQRNRALMQWCAVILNIVLNYYLIKMFSWKGAIYSTLISYLFLDLLYSINIVLLIKSSIKKRQ